MFAPTSAHLELTDRAVREATLDRLTKLQRMLSFLNHAVEAVYGVVRSITADVRPLQV
jgi:hypothetical protein